jgi:hypothetical protein
MTELEFIKKIDATLTQDEILPGVRASFYYDGVEYTESPIFVKVKTNEQDGGPAKLYAKPLLAVFKKLSKDPEYFTAGNRNHAFDELMRDSDIRHQDEHDPYPSLYTNEAYYIALIEKLLSHTSAAP